MQKTGEMVLVNDALAEIDELIKASDQARPERQRELGDQLRMELQEELEHMEVTLREEFVAVQLQVDKLGREMSRLRARDQDLSGEA
jgi:BMFP domain-containing protein YqiC